MNGWNSSCNRFQQRTEPAGSQKRKNSFTTNTVLMYVNLTSLQHTGRKAECVRFSDFLAYGIIRQKSSIIYRVNRLTYWSALLAAFKIAKRSDGVRFQEIFWTGGRLSSSAPTLTTRERRREKRKTKDFGTWYQPRRLYYVLTLMVLSHQHISNTSLLSFWSRTYSRSSKLIKRLMEVEVKTPAFRLGSAPVRETLI